MKRQRHLELIVRHREQELGRIMIVDGKVEADDGTRMTLALTTQHSDDLYEWIRRLKFPEEYEPEGSSTE